MTVDEAKKWIEFIQEVVLECLLPEYMSEFGNCNEALTMALQSLDPQLKWNPVSERPMTDEEKESYDFTEDYAFIYDCKLPENDQEVLITTSSGRVTTTTFFDDYGCYFENYEDAGEVIAWMPLPEPMRRE